MNISVIVPVKNRGDILPQLLAALEKQDYPKELTQVVVIDDGSTDDTAKILKSYGRRAAGFFCCANTGGISAAGARNRGLQMASGELIIFLDVDTIPGADLVSKHVALHKQQQNIAFCLMGRIEMAAALNIPEQARLNEQDWRRPIIGLTQVSWWEYRTPNTSLHRAVIEQIDGFNEKLIAIEDTEFAYRLSKIGVRFYCDDRIAATHFHPMTIDSYLEKGRIYGMAVQEWYRQNPELRQQLALRYGVYATEMPMNKKMKYIIRSIFVNRHTIDMIVYAGKRLRRRWFDLSDSFYQCAFRYQIRKAFKRSFAPASLSE